MKDVEIIGMLKSYVSATLVGMGALKGAPCQCVITTNADGTHTVTMKWVDNEGDQHTDSFNVLNGQVGSMEDIANVQITSIADGQVLAWDSTLNKWVNTTNSATVASLENIGDIQFTSLADGEFLMWDDTAGKWVNEALGTAAKADTTSTVTEDSTDVLTSGGAFTALAGKADKATTLAGYGITDAYTKTETDNAITAEIEKLDASDSAVAGNYVTAVSEADGKISVTRAAADVTPTANSTKMLTSGGAKTALDDKADKVSNATSGNFAGLDSNGNLTDSGKKASDFQTALTFDDAPTENSNNPVKSNGIYIANRNIYEVMGKNGAKNKDPFDIDVAKALNTTGTWTGNSYELNGITFAFADNGKVTVSGTASALCSINISGNYDLNGDYIITGCPSGGGGSTYSLRIYDSSATVVADDVGEGISFTANNLANCRTNLIVRKDAAISTPIVFAPMIRDSKDTDPTYQPYAKTNRELTAEQGYCTEDQYTAIQTLLS